MSDEHTLREKKIFNYGNEHKMSMKIKIFSIINTYTFRKIWFMFFIIYSSSSCLHIYLLTFFPFTEKCHPF